MATYDKSVKRSSAPVPDNVSKEIIQVAPQASVVLTNARKTPMSTKIHKQPVLASLPEAHWVNGDTGLSRVGG